MYLDKFYLAVNKINLLQMKCRNDTLVLLANCILFIRNNLVEILLVHSKKN